MPARTPILVGGATIAGFLVAIVLGGGLGALPGGAAPLTVRVENVGSNDASARIEISKPGEGVAGIAEGAIPPGKAFEYPLPNDRSGDHTVKVIVRWGSEFGERRGDRTTIVDPSGCGGSQLMLVTIAVDTTRGVSFRPTEADCV